MASVTVSVEVTDDDKSRLRAIIGDTASVDDVILLVAGSGAAELLAHATGRAVFSTVPEIRLYRIYQLLAGGISLETAQALVPSLFKVTPSRARRLVEDTVARYEVELKKVVEDRIQKLLDEAQFIDDRWEVLLPDGVIRASVLEKARQTSLADPESARRGQIWRFPDETYAAVRKAFKLKKKEKPKS